MPSEENTPQPAPESPSPAIETPAPSAEPATPIEIPPAPAEASSAPVEVAQAPVEATAHIPVYEPLAPETASAQSYSEPTPEPFKPTPAPASAATSVAKAVEGARDFLTKARVSIQDRKRKKRDKIMKFLDRKAQNGSTGSPQVTNDEVEKLLHVSDATATRYLSALEKEGKIQQVGKTGTGVVYQKNG